MSDKLKVSIGNPSASFSAKPSKTFTGRLIGFINKEAVRAVKNTEDSARKIFSESSIPIKETPGSIYGPDGLRFVIATSDHTPLRRIVFISPVIRFVAHVHKGRIFTCMNGKEYRVEED